ncbi:glycosyltransferase family 39 protein [Methanobacterium alcaliphilum]|uniref:glycosyltransferase family 39 protein n=1 Tax=Methanobacterium alcaliphilum TaxID=392018 RepID=UPI00200A9892|nr:glycosyltransferase family 39 protein [Methanobacterium alcaliphilum]MCK9152171.1 glycosyltransferase family 39 protein [Methanobacterium alcaliphilum]
MNKLSLSEFITKHQNKFFLILIILFSFLVRLIPSRGFNFAGNDAYLHHDIVMRIVDQGFGIISNDPLSWMGLSSYGYPPLYHILGTLLYQLFHTPWVFFVLPALLGVGSILVFYKISQEIYDETKIALLSTLLFAFVPSFVTRTAVFIPESLGLFLFTCILYFIIKYIKSIPGYENLENLSMKGFLKIFKGNYKYLILALLIWIVYLFTHRGWVFLGITLAILLVTFLLPSWGKKPVTISLIFLIIIAGFFEFISIAARFQDIPVTILGFPKWVGIIQIIAGLYGIFIFIKSKNTVYRFLALWAIIFLLLGSNSFRFRDPYSAIPLALIGGYVLYTAILPKIYELSIWNNYKLFGKNIGKYCRTLVILILLLTPVAQGAYIAYSSVVQASPGETESFEWINENTPANATFLTLRDNAYLLIGNTQRKDVALWKTVYEGFMGQSPTLKETAATVADVDIIFSSSDKSEAYYMLKNYNVSYIYITKEMYDMASIRYGLASYMPYDTHFKNSFDSGDTSIYQFIPDPELKPPTNQLNITSNSEYARTIGFIEEFWNGYSYSEIGGKYQKDKELDFEFGGDYKGNYNLNAQIALLYNQLYQKTNNMGLNDRSEYIINWLNYKQRNNGSFPSSIPPEDYTLTTMETIYPLMNLETNNINKTHILNRGSDFIKNQTGTDFINISDSERNNIENQPDYISLKTDAQISGMNDTNKKRIVSNIIMQQKSDGSWSDHAYQNIEVLKGLSLYYNLTSDPNVKDSIKKGAQWLKNNQNSDGSFVSDGDPVIYGVNYYADAALVYYTVKDNESVNKTMRFINSQNIRMDTTPLKSYLTLIFDLTYIYGDDKAIQISNQLI